MGLFVLDEAALVFGQEVDEREQVGIWEDVEELLDDALGSGVDDKPVADNGYFHSDSDTSLHSVCVSTAMEATCATTTSGAARHLLQGRRLRLRACT